VIADEAAREIPGLETLEDALGHRFRDRTLLEKALTHSSYSNERERAGVKTDGAASEGPARENNERLEFLGDSVVGMVAADLLYRAHPSWREGELTRALHQLVDRRGLSRLARELDLGVWLRLGRTELRSAGHQKSTILADAMEAVLGALFLDGGLEPVRRFVARAFASALAADAPRVDLDPKTRFQEWVMEGFGVFPSYRDVRDSGVDGDEERFTVEALIRDQPVARGSARSKRIAERRAAEDAYARRDELARALAASASASEGMGDV
jgi:ribonuclease-3